MINTRCIEFRTYRDQAKYPTKKMPKSEKNVIKKNNIIIQLEVNDTNVS